jgi:hypothetical protein
MLNSELFSFTFAKIHPNSLFCRIRIYQNIFVDSLIMRIVQGGCEMIIDDPGETIV